jgi:hypothetical protein
MKSTTIGTLILRALASAWIRSIWWQLPSTRAIQVRRPVGVAAVGLGEPGCDHRCGVVGHRGVQPLARGHRHRDRRLGGGVGRFGVVGQDVGDSARGGGDVEDRGDLAHPFAVPFLALGSAAGQFLPDRGLGGTRPQPVGAHHHPFGVERQPQHLIIAGRIRGVDGVEGIHIRRRRRGQRLDLPFPDPDRGGPLDRGRRVGERATGRLHRRQAAQPVPVPFHRQVGLRVGRVQVGQPGRPVGETGHRHLTEPGGQLPGPAPVPPATRPAVSVNDPAQLPFPTSAEIKMVLHQLA